MNAVLSDRIVLPLNISWLLLMPESRMATLTFLLIELEASLFRMVSVFMMSDPQDTEDAGVVLQVVWL